MAHSAGVDQKATDGVGKKGKDLRGSDNRQNSRAVCSRRIEFPEVRVESKKGGDQMR